MDIKVSHTRKIASSKKLSQTSSKNNQIINGLKLYHPAFIKMLSLPSISCSAAKFNK